LFQVLAAVRRPLQRRSYCCRVAWWVWWWCK